MLCSVKAQAVVLEMLDAVGLPSVIGCMALEEVRVAVTGSSDFFQGDYMM